MKKLERRLGEALTESLLSLLVLLVTGVLLALASAVILRHSARIERAVTFVDASAASVYPAGTDGCFSAELGDVPMGSVTVWEQGGLYYYEVG